MKTATQKKDSSFKNGLIVKKLTSIITSHFCGLLNLTESLQIQVSATGKQHMCLVHVVTKTRNQK